MENLLELFYKNRCETPSDINEHVPTLKRYAEECEHITEMGVRSIVSTYALLMGKPKRMISYDINWANGIENVVKLANDKGIDFDFRIANTTDLTIVETDLLFIDTWHVYPQLKKEFELHANKAKKYIILQIMIIKLLNMNSL